MGIRLKLFLPTLLSLVIFSAFIHFIWAPEQESELIESFKSIQKDFLKTIEPEISRALISNDIAALNEFLDQQMRIHHLNWREIRLNLPNNDRLYPLFDYQEPKGKYIFKITHNITEDYEGNVGALTLFVDWSAEHKKITAHTIKIETALLAILALIALSSTLLQNRIILTPLIKLKKVVNQFQQGNYNSELKTNRKDEIGELIINFELMRTQRRINEESLRIAATAFDIHEGIVITDSNQKILRVNKAFTLITGYNEDEVIGRNPSLLQSGKHDEHFYQQLWRAINTDGKWSGEIWNKRKSGEIYPQHASITAVNNTNNETTHYVGSFLDISESKQQQRDLKLKADELEIARDKAEIASKAKSDFLATMSHEIRTPMNGVLGMTQLLSDTNLNDQQKDYLDTIKKSGQNLLAIINDILDFSKIEAQKMELEPVPFNLHDNCFEVTKLLTTKAREKGLELLFNMSADCPNFVIGDPGRIRQVLINIIGNAIKFTNDGHILLEIRCSNQNNSYVDIEFFISDTGIGIPAEQQDKLFHAFTQADSSTTRKFGGTGLGLSICRQLINLMGGEIKLNSEVDRGSEFSFLITLPVTDTPETIPVDDVTGINLLVVDDNPTNLRIIQEQTTNAGINTVTVTDTNQAQIKLDETIGTENNFDAVILDYCMPIMDGAEFGKKLLANPDTSKLPLILLTSAAVSGDIQRFNDLGFSGYLTKPVMNRTLIAMISAVTNSQNSHDKKQILTSHSVSDAIAVSSGKKSEQSLQFSKVKILLAEDDLINQQVASGLLRKLNIQPDVAANGLEVLAKVKDCSYDLILMDCLMPSMDGFEATRQLRDNPNTRSIPIVALTANAQKSDRERCLESGMDDFLSKPFEFDDLSDMLSRWLPDAPSFQQVTYTQSPSVNSELMNFDTYEKLKSTIPDVFDSIITTFITETEMKITEIKEHIQKKHLEDSRLLAHSLKSSSATIGAMSLSVIAAQIEKDIIQNRSDNLLTLSSELESSYLITKQSIHEYQKTEG